MRTLQRPSTFGDRPLTYFYLVCLNQFSFFFFFLLSHAVPLILFVTTSNYTYRTNRCVNFQFTLYEQNMLESIVPFVPVLGLLVTLVHRDSDIIFSSSPDHQINNDDHLEREGRCQGTFILSSFIGFQTRYPGSLELDWIYGPQVTSLEVTPGIRTRIFYLIIRRPFCSTTCIQWLTSISITPVIMLRHKVT